MEKVLISLILLCLALFPRAALASQTILVHPLLIMQEWVIDQWDAVTIIGRGERIMSTPAGSTLTSEQLHLEVSTVHTTLEQPHSEVSTIHTTLYDLIEALSQEVGPGEDHLVTAALVHLINSGEVKFADDWRELRVVFS